MPLMFLSLLAVPSVSQGLGSKAAVSVSVWTSFHKGAVVCYKYEQEGFVCL